MAYPENLHDDNEGPALIQPSPLPAGPERLHDGGEGPAPIQPRPLPDESPGQEDVLGLRISAALIDLVLLAGLFTIMAAATGGVTTGSGSFNVSLSAGWAAVFVAVAGLYYFALEAVAGQTVGKRLLGVQVYGPGRARPSAGAIAGRTLLRLVDFLPVLYLVGFVTMMATGARRQRIGDLAARTGVARAAPARRRSLAAVPLAVVLLAAAGLSAYRTTLPGETLTYQGHGVWFDYPAGWQELSGYTSSSSGGGAKLWGTAVGPGTPYDNIGVDAYRTQAAVTAQNIGAVAADLESLLRQAGMTVQGTPEKITMAGLPGVRVRVTGTVSGTRYASTVVFAFNGTTEYEVNCQYTAGMGAQVGQACDQVTGSFHVNRAVPGAAAPATSPPGSSTTTATPSPRTTQASSPVNQASGNGSLGAKVVPAPAGFALSQAADVHNGPMNAAGFNQWMGAPNLAASLHFVHGYDVTYDSNTTSDSIEVTLFQFATPADATAFKAGYEPSGPITSRTDPVIPGGDDYDSTAPSQGSYDHGVIATKGNLAFVIDYLTGSAAPVPLVEKMARQQYAAL